MVGAFTARAIGFANDLKKRLAAANTRSRIVITGRAEI